MIKFKDLYITLAEDQELLERHRGPFTHTAPTAKSMQVCSQISKIGKLKEYLVKALAVADALEEEVGDDALQTVSEVEMLEGKLLGAIEELRARKRELENEAA